MHHSYTSSPKKRGISKRAKVVQWVEMIS